MDVSAVEQACERLYTAQVGLFFHFQQVRRRNDLRAGGLFVVEERKRGELETRSFFLFSTTLATNVH